MKLLMVSFWQRPISRILHQRMPEEVFQLRVSLDQPDEAGGFKMGKVLFDFHNFIIVLLIGIKRYIILSI